MAKVTIEAGICGFTTIITTSCEDGQNVSVTFKSDCPNVGKIGNRLATIDAYTEIFAKPQSTRTHEVLGEALPHISCPIYTGLLKAIEVGAGLALPKDAHIAIES